MLQKIRLKVFNFNANERVLMKREAIYQVANILEMCSVIVSSIASVRVTALLHT